MNWARLRSLNWRQLLRTAGLILGGAVFLYQFGSGFSAAFQLTVQADFPFRLVAAITLVMISNAVQIYVWSLIMRCMGVQVPMKQAFFGYLSSSLARYIPGGIWGYVSRNEWLYQSYGASYKKTNLVSVLEIAGLLITAGGIIGIHYLSTYIPELALPIWVIYLVLLFLICPGFSGVVYLFTKIRLSESISAMDAKLIAYVIGVSVPLYTIVWLSLGGAAYFVVRSTYDIWSVDVLDATFVYTISWLIGFLLIFIPAGLGIRELSMSRLLISQFNIAINTANGISVLTRFVGLSAELLSLGIAMLLVYRWRHISQGAPR